MLGPGFGICGVCTIASIQLFRFDFFKGSAGILASITGGIFLVITALIENGNDNYEISHKSTGLLTFAFIIGFFSENLGNVVLDIILGHVETDYFYYVNPPKKLDRKIKSITM